jgi:hypothetical protein
MQPGVHYSHFNNASDTLSDKIRSHRSAALFAVLPYLIHSREIDISTLNSTIASDK